MLCYKKQLIGCIWDEMEVNKNNSTMTLMHFVFMFMSEENKNEFGSNKTMIIYIFYSFPAILSTKTLHPRKFQLSNLTTNYPNHSDKTPNVWNLKSLMLILMPGKLSPRLN